MPTRFFSDTCPGLGPDKGSIISIHGTKRWRTRFAAALLGLALSACTSAHRDPATSAKRPAAQSEKSARDSEAEIRTRAEAHAHYAAAIVHELGGNNAAALEEYGKAAEKDPGNEWLVLEVSRRLMQARKTDQALKVLSQAAAQPDSTGAIYARLGLAYFQVGKTNEAIAANRTAVRKSPATLAGYQNLFVWYLQGKQNAEAWQTLEDALKQRDTSAEFQLGLADLYINYALQVPAKRAEANERAISLLKQTAQTPRLPAGQRLRLADALSALGDSETATGLYLDLLKVLPEAGQLREQIHARLADFYLRRSDRARAVEQLEALLKQDPTNPMAHYFLGAIAQEQRNPAAAEDYFRRTLVLAPDFEPAYYDLASVQLSQNHATDALATLEKARAKFEQGFSLEVLTGLACMQQKNYTNATRHLLTAEVIARATDPKRLNSAFYFQLGAAYERGGQAPQAEQQFRKCLELDPNSAEAQNYLGYMWAERGTNLNEAFELITKAVTAQPTNAAYLDSLAWVHFKRGEVQEALKYILKAVDLLEEPDPAVFDHLGDIYQALGQTEKAREAWRKSLKLEPNADIQRKLDREAPP